MEKITLSTNLVNAILQYLGSRPYAEVFQVVEAIQAEAKSPTEPAAESPKVDE
jgi:hypothetical protein